MDLFVYSDESGVFDYKHNKIFTFGGLIFIGKEQKDIATRKFLHAERCLRQFGTHSCLSLIHISEPTRRLRGSRMPSSA